MAKELSGSQWVARFPTSRDIAALRPPFRGNVERFVDALHAAGATVAISATLRPPERAYLMHYAFLIARKQVNPGAVPARAGVDIEWEHATLAASRSAAQAMVQAYGIAVLPALDSNHIAGKAIDMTIGWQGTPTILDAQGNAVGLSGSPKSGSNPHLIAVGATYKVFKLKSDPPHWSFDGH